MWHSRTILSFILILVTSLPSCLAAPVILPSSISSPLTRRALQVSLLETSPNTPRWHFALVVHPAIAQATPINQGVIYETVLNGNRLNGVRSIPLQPSRLKVDHRFTKARLSLIAAKSEKDDKALGEAIAKLLLAIPINIQPPAPNFDNCGDYTVKAAEELRKHGYLSEKDAKELKSGYQKLEKEVRITAKTDQNTKGWQQYFKSTVWAEGEEQQEQPVVGPKEPQRRLTQLDKPISNVPVVQPPPNQPQQVVKPSSPPQRSNSITWAHDGQWCGTYGCEFGGMGRY